MELVKAKKIAEKVRETLAPYCEQCEIAGSIRRGKAKVKDIEIVAAPKMRQELNLFGEVVGEVDELLRFLEQGSTAAGWRFLKGGERMRQYWLPKGIVLDLFIVKPPADWGVIFTIRTGPAEFSKWIVTQQMHGGALDNNFRVNQGCVWDWKGQRVPMNEELDFLEFLGLGWIEPSERVARWR